MSRRLFALAASGLLVVALPLAAQASPSPTGLTARNVAVCPTPQNTLTARCHAILHELVDRTGKPVDPKTSGAPAGYGPGDLQSAYNLAHASATWGAGTTVAIVDAYDDPNAAADVATYRGQFGLPGLASCTVGKGAIDSRISGQPCFVKVNQSGVVGSYPRANGGWAQEISLDLDMASAICPNCNIVLVEASSSSFANLGASVDTAASLGAVAISNSYGSTGDASDSTYGSYYNHPGIAVTASTGDNGYGVSYPASSDFTVAVGGTSLTESSTSWSETAWSGAGSGCSTYQAKPDWQTGAVPSAVCANRAVADVSADADPNTGVAVYDSYSYQGASGWMQFGGTSVSSPIVASVYALAKGSGATWTGNPATTLYSAPTSLNDVKRGSNGSCGGSILCTAADGWDGPTGLGTPDGLAAFGSSSGGSTGGVTIAPAIESKTCSSATCSFTASGDGTLTWDFGNGKTATGSSPSVTYSSPGSYKVTVRNTAGSDSTTITCASSGRGHKTLSCS